MFLLARPERRITGRVGHSPTWAAVFTYPRMRLG